MLNSVIRMESGHGRALPDLDAVPGLARLAYRDFGAEHRLSASARGLYLCTGSRKSFDEWFALRRREFALVPGRDFAGCVVDGVGDVAVDVAVVNHMFVGSTSHQAKAAVRVCAQAFQLERASAVRMRAWEVGGGRTWFGEFEGDSFGFDRFFPVERRPTPEGEVLVVWAGDACGMTFAQLDRWLKKPCHQAAFREGHDYYVADSRVDTQRGGPRLEYVLTLHAAVRVTLMLWTRQADGVLAHLMECVGRAWADGLEAAALGGRPQAAALEAGGGAAVVPAGLAAEALDQDGAEPELGHLVPAAERLVGGVASLGVVARDVHAFLDSASRFNDWWREQSGRAGLVEGRDFERLLLGFKPNPGGRGRPRQDYVLTLKAAKKIGMTARGTRGNDLREYFLECERRASTGGGVTPSPVAAADDGAPLAAAAAVPALSADTIPLSLSAFLDLKGFRAGAGADFRRTVTVAESGGVRGLEAALVRKLLEEPAPGHSCFRHPTTAEWLISRAALEAWWRENQVAVMRASVEG